MTIGLPVIPVSTMDLPDSWYVPDLVPLISNRNSPLHQYVPQCRESAPRSWRIQYQGHLGGCQNYGPFLDPYFNTAPNM